MRDSMPTRIMLPELQFAIGDEPNQVAGPAINHFAVYKNVDVVKQILGDDLFQRINDSFLGPVLRFSSRNLHMSAKIIHCLLTRSLQTCKKNELWFHFGAQPMRFSIREFHTVTGLKCTECEEVEDKDSEVYKYDWGTNHTPEELIEVLRVIPREKVEERFSLGMLIVIESLLLQRYKGNRFSKLLIKRAQDMITLMNYSWGRDAFDVLLNSIKRKIPSHLNKDRFELHGFPFVLHLWILESVPLLQVAFNKVSSLEPEMAFLCEKYIDTKSPALEQVRSIEGYANLRVVCVLPSIPNDPEDKVFLEDIDNPDLESLVDIVKNGYKLTKEDWERESVDAMDAIEQMAKSSYQFGNAVRETIWFGFYHHRLHQFNNLAIGALSAS